MEITEKQKQIILETEEKFFAGRELYSMQDGERYTDSGLTAVAWIEELASIYEDVDLEDEQTLKNLVFNSLSKEFVEN